MSRQPPPSTRVILSGVRSVTHLVYASSWLRSEVARAEGVVEVVVLDVGSGFGRARVDEPQIREFLPRHPRLLVTTTPRADHWKASTGLHRVLLSVGLPGTRAWVRLVGAGRGRRPQVVVIDEGIGSFGDVRSRQAAYRRQGGSAAHTAVRTAVVTSAGRLLTDVKWSLYERVGGGWVVREEVAGEFRRRLTGSSPPPGRAVYATQPWPDIGVMSQASYLAHLRAVGEQCAAVGMSFALWPHPSEHLDRYGEFDLVAGSAPAELTREVAEASVVIGSNSTALLNLSAVHGTPAIRVTAPELRRLEAALSPAQRALLDTFLPPPVPVAELRARLDAVRLNRA
jgi:hypothetical protein